MVIDIGQTRCSRRKLMGLHHNIFYTLPLSGKESFELGKDMEYRLVEDRVCILWDKGMEYNLLDRVDSLGILKDVLGSIFYIPPLSGNHQAQ